jgi:hypothetical protein
MFHRDSQRFLEIHGAFLCVSLFVSVYLCIIKNTTLCFTEIHKGFWRFTELFFVYLFLSRCISV